MTEEFNEELDAAGYPPAEEPVTEVASANAFYNAGDLARDWPDLQHPATGTTLHLEPGEVVHELVVPEGFNCFYLRPLAEKG
jgi:hypothetical protein